MSWIVFRANENKSSEIWNGTAPVPGENILLDSIVLEFVIFENDPNPNNYKLENGLLVYDPPTIETPTPDPNTPDILGFYTALFNDPIWGVEGDQQNPPNSLRAIRPNLAMSKGAMIENLYQPEVLQMTWADMKLGLIAQLGSEIAQLIIDMVEQHAVTYNIPIVALV